MDAMDTLGDLKVSEITNKELNSALDELLNAKF
jgi:hypothetical protein